ncbi:amidase family protein [Nonomuraea ferruginea]
MGRRRGRRRWWPPAPCRWGWAATRAGAYGCSAAWCGVAGLKPTFGRVPLTGHFPRCGSLEDGRTVIGPIAGTVADLAATLEVIAGPDGMDGGTPPVPLADPGAVRVPGLRVATMAGGRRPRGDGAGGADAGRGGGRPSRSGRCPTCGRRRWS